MTDTDKAAEAPKKKGKMLKIVAIGGGVLLLLGGGVGAGLYATSSGMIGGGGGHAEKEDDTPRLVPKSEEVRASLAAEGGEGEAAGTGGKPTPEGAGGERYASSYFPIEKEFTANLLDSVHFVQVGIAISTPYDSRVLENVKTHEIAVRSAILMALGETSEDEVFTSNGKKQLQRRLLKAINETLQQKEGFGGVGNVYFTTFVVQ